MALRRPFGDPHRERTALPGDGQPEERGRRRQRRARNGRRIFREDVLPPRRLISFITAYSVFVAQALVLLNLSFAISLFFC